MKLSDYVVKFIEAKSESVFLLSGGGIMHLVDSIHLTESKRFATMFLVNPTVFSAQVGTAVF